MNEFEIIKNYFKASTFTRPEVFVGIGDDAALLNIPEDQTLVVTTDTFIEDVHFPKATQAADIAYKSLAVNLSDIAAMGATPAFATLALTLPYDNRDWLHNFCIGFFELAKQHHMTLIGGDLTRGPLSITITLLGLTSKNKALLRSQAQPNDLIYVTGTLGDAGLALNYLQKKMQLTLTADAESFILRRLNRPTPRVNAGLALRHIAHAAIDISDGLIADLNHILHASKVGAKVCVDNIPLSSALKHSTSKTEAIKLALSSGDDYELCFTVPKDKKIELEKQLENVCPYTCIGVIENNPGLNLFYQDGSTYHGETSGYQHF